MLTVVAIFFAFIEDVHSLSQGTNHALRLINAVFVFIEIFFLCFTYKIAPIRRLGKKCVYIDTYTPLELGLVLYKSY